jgi:hypothetical protein
MTKESLRQLIREMVQEEVRQVLPQVMTEIFSSKLNPQVSNKTVVQKPVVQQPIKKEYKKYTDNELLNKALNETVGGVPREGDIASSGFNSAPSVMDHINQAPPVVAQALTKDYSALMKAIDKKRKGGISSNNV